MTSILYPDVHVQLTGTDGNAFAVMGAVTSAIKEYARENPDVLSPRAASDVCNEFRTEAMSGGYDHLLQTAMRYVDVS